MEAKQYAYNHKITKEIKKNIREYIDANDNENTMTQILWEAATAVLRGQVTGIQSYLKKQEKFQTFSNLYKFQNFTSCFKATKERRTKLVEGKKS